MLRKAFKRTWQGIIFVIGFAVVLIGIVMIVTPGPALIVIPLGLLILASEFIWAENLLARFKEKFKIAKERFSKRAKKK